MQCCDRECNTPFCPICGRATSSAANVGAALLKQIRALQQASETRLKQHDAFRADHLSDRLRDRRPATRARLVARCERYRAMVAWIEEHMRKDAEGGG